jgi:oligoribonuclease NrnB/cAMP/cGMP phosphodiesterase (DHH superfamily)
MFDYIIYHSNCLDGFTGFFVAHISGKLTKDVYVHPDVPSTNKIPPNIQNKNVIIIDVAMKKDILEEIFKLAKSVVFIDHHISIKNDVDMLYKKYNNSGNITIVYDESRCGASLSWSFFFDRHKIPLFLKYIEDQDTGRWQHSKTRPFIFALRAYYTLSHEPKALAKWHKLLNKDVVLKLIKKGQYMRKYNDHLVNSGISKHTLERFPSKKVFDMFPNIFIKPGEHVVAVYCGLNCPSSTELAIAALKKIPDADFCMMWIYNLDSKKYVVSVRSRSVDVGTICKAFGGGGHTLAAAFSFSSNLMSISDLFDGPSLPRSIIE